MKFEESCPIIRAQDRSFGLTQKFDKLLLTHALKLFIALTNNDTKYKKIKSGMLTIHYCSIFKNVK